MFQVRTLKELKGVHEWEDKMLKKHRKTLVLCRKCNDKVHRIKTDIIDGKPDTGRPVSPVWRRVSANLPSKDGKAVDA